jgi:hypothetical protein
VSKTVDEKPKLTGLPKEKPMTEYKRNHIWDHAYKLKLGELVEKEVGDVIIEILQRIPGGWEHTTNFGFTITSIFIPYSKENKN